VTTCIVGKVDILGSTAEGVGELIIREIRLRQSKIAQRHMSRRIQQYILGLQITISISFLPVQYISNSPVNDIVFVQMLQRQDQFRDIEPRSILAKPSLLLKVPKQLSTTLVVRHEIQLFLCLEREFESDEERALERPLEDLPLADSMCHFLLRDNLLLREHFHGVYPTCVLFAYLEDTTECPSSDELEEFKFAGFEVDSALQKDGA